MTAADISAAIRQEQADRDDAFLGFPETVAGFDLRPMTLRDWLVLLRVGNFFACGLPEMSDAAKWHKIGKDAASFIWLQSVDYKPHDKQAKRKIEAMLGGDDMDLGALASDIREYVDRTFSDAPPADGKGQPVKSYWSIGASFVHQMGKAYGWSRERTMKEPLRVLWQLWKIESYERDPKTPRFNPSDQQVSAWLKTTNARN
jgi:hypothetical protein